MDVPVNYAREDFVDVVRTVTRGRGVPLALESVGGDVLERTFDCLQPTGRLVSVGASSGHSSPRFRLHTLFELGISVAGFTLGHWLQRYPELVRPSVERVLDLFDRGLAVPVVSRVFAADDVAAAHEFLAGRKSVGRTVVVMSSSGRESR